MTEFTNKTPTSDEIDEYLRRAAHERSEAFASIVHWLRALLASSPEASIVAKPS